MPGALYRERKPPLVRCANAGVTRVYYLRLAGNKTLQELDFLIVNIFQVLRTEKALGHYD